MDNNHQSQHFSEEIRDRIDDTLARKDVELLNELYRNTQIGKLAIESVVKRTDREDFRGELLSHYDGFDALGNKIVGEMTKRNVTPKSPGYFKNLMLKTAIGVNSIMDDTVSNLADMVIKGNNTGITDINKMLNDFGESADESTHSLAMELLRMQQSNIDSLKPYL